MVSAQLRCLRFLFDVGISEGAVSVQLLVCRQSSGVGRDEAPD